MGVSYKGYSARYGGNTQAEAYPVNDVEQIKNHSLTARKFNKYVNYTPLTISLPHIFEVGDKSRMFRKPLRIGPPGRRDRPDYCLFYDANDHETSKCQHLRDHIEDLVRKGSFAEFVARGAIGEATRVVPLVKNKIGAIGKLCLP